MVNNLSDKQTEAVVYLEKQIEHYREIGQRLRVIGFPLVAGVYENMTHSLKDAIDIQIRVIRHPEEYLGFNRKP
jgi:hypothetical protein